MKEWLALAALYILFYIVGSSFLQIIFVQNLSKVHSHAVFCTVFALCLGLLFMVLCESAAFMAPETRWVVWRVSIPTLAILLGLAVPSMAATSVLLDIIRAPRIVYPAVAITSLISVGMVYYYSAEDSLLQSVVSGIAGCGVTIMAMLSGFGAVTTPYVYLLPYMYRAQRIDKDDLRISQQATLETILSKHQTAARRQPKEQRKGLSRVWDSVRGHDAAAEEKALAAEVAALQRVGTSLFLQMHEVSEMEEASLQSFTWKGRVFTALGAVLGVYCVGKVILSSVNVAFHRTSSVDPITRFANLATEYFALSIDLSVYINQVSFVFLTATIFMSIRGFLLTVLKVITLYASSIGPSSVTLCFTEIMGMYYFSAVLLIRASLPEQNREMITTAMGVINFQMYHTWFDMVFVAAALVSSACLVVMAGVAKSSD